MLRLPMPLDVHHVKSFWLVIVGLLGLVLGTLSPLAFGAGWAITVGAFLVVFAFLGFFFQKLAFYPYRAWNVLARVFGKYATKALLFLCYSIIHIGVGRKQSDLVPLEIDRYQSLWRIQEGNHGCQQLAGSPGTPMQASWNVQFVQWAMASGNWWMCSLLPCMALISLLAEAEPSNVVSANVYTLY